MCVLLIHFLFPPFRSLNFEQRFKANHLIVQAKIWKILGIVKPIKRAWRDKLSPIKEIIYWDFKCENIFVAKELTFTLQCNLSEKVNDHVGTIFYLEFYMKSVLSSTQYWILVVSWNSRSELEFPYLNWVPSHSLNCCYIWFLFLSDNFLQNCGLNMNFP